MLLFICHEHYDGMWICLISGRCLLNGFRCICPDRNRMEGQNKSGRAPSFAIRIRRSHRRWWQAEHSGRYWHFLCFVGFCCIFASIYFPIRGPAKSSKSSSLQRWRNFRLLSGAVRVSCILLGRRGGVKTTLWLNRDYKYDGDEIIIQQLRISKIAGFYLPAFISGLWLIDYGRGDLADLESVPRRIHKVLAQVSISRRSRWDVSSRWGALVYCRVSLS